MSGSKEYWRFVICIVSVPAIVFAGGCSSNKPSSSPSGQGAASQQATPGNPGAGQGSMPNASATDAPPPNRVRSGILTYNSVGNKRIYGFIDPNTGAYSEAVTFTIPNSGSVQSSSFRALAASPDLSKLAATSTVNGQSAAGWIDSGGQFTAVTASVTPGPFGGIPPSYSAIGFDGAGNFYYQSSSQQSLHPQMFKLTAGSTSNAQEVTAKGAQESQLNAYLNYDGSMQFGCNAIDSWLGPNAIVFVAGGATQIDKDRSPALTPTPVALPSAVMSRTLPCCPQPIPSAYGMRSAITMGPRLRSSTTTPTSSTTTQPSTSSRLTEIASPLW